MWPCGSSPCALRGSYFLLGLGLLRVLAALIPGAAVLRGPGHLWEAELGLAYVYIQPLSKERGLAWDQLQQNSDTAALIYLPHGMQDLCSPTRDQTCTPCSGSVESQPLDCQGSPTDALTCRHVPSLSEPPFLTGKCGQPSLCWRIIK